MAVSIKEFRKYLRKEFKKHFEMVDRERRSKHGYDLEDEGPGVSYGDLPEDVDRVRRSEDGYGETEFEEGVQAEANLYSDADKEGSGKIKKGLSHAAPSDVDDAYPGPPLAMGESDEMLPESMSLKDAIQEVAPPGWEKTVKKMKKEPDIDNPYALAWHMKGKGYKPGGKE